MFYLLEQIFKSIMFLWILWEFYAFIECILITSTLPKLLQDRHILSNLPNFIFTHQAKLISIWAEPTLLCYYISTTWHIVHSTTTQNSLVGKECGFLFVSHATSGGYLICFLCLCPLFWSEGSNSTDHRAVMRVQWNINKAFVKYLVYRKCSGQ